MLGLGWPLCFSHSHGTQAGADATHIQGELALRELPQGHTHKSSRRLGVCSVDTEEEL